MAEPACYCGYCKVWMPASMWETHIKTEKHQQGVAILLGIVDTKLEWAKKGGE
jgi:hypothetical protein